MTSNRLLSLLRAFAKASSLRQGNNYIFRLVLAGSFLVALSITLQLLYSTFILGNFHVLPRAGFAFAIIVYLLCTWRVVKHRPLVAVWMIVIIYLLVALGVLLLWGINSPIGILTLGFVIFLSNILLGARYILATTCLVAIGLSLIQLAASLGIYEPDISSLGRKSTVADLISYLTVFCVFAITSWLSSFQNEQSLNRALRAESALLEEKRLLSRRLTEQARSLRAAQNEEMYQLYKFAELGQLTSSLFHELANHLSVLHLDIQEFSSSTQKVARNKISESISKIDEMVDSVRKRIAHENQYRQLDVYECARNAITGIDKMNRTNKSFVSISLDNALPLKSRRIYGDPIRLIQVITILLTNATQACTLSKNSIKINLSLNGGRVFIKIIDYGKGISSEQQEKLFKPHASSKKNGLGIGLYIAQQFVQTHFGGIIRLDNTHPGTCFVIELPHVR